MDPLKSQSPIIQGDRDTIDSELIATNQLVLVAFESPWSQPCHVLDLTLEDLAATWVGNVRILKINADNNPDLSLWYDIQFVPTLLYFVKGVLRGRTVGTATREAILTKLLTAIQSADTDGTAQRGLPAR